ncbi:unnamed protein product (mitochondrion) [Plasmodiophora brassicae]|uniref:HECT-type E3 ubiquitin transferase E3D n=1 Tax=Plasmodiophora brassicae TaxID=37360 RepID=A0A3P3Y440_PLABS|nr:unnamed protein product [Plasmodiophora brassicae]
MGWSGRPRDGPNAANRGDLFTTARRSMGWCWSDYEWDYAVRGVDCSSSWMDGDNGSNDLHVVVEKLPHVRRLVISAWKPHGPAPSVRYELNRMRVDVPGVGSTPAILFDCHIDACRARVTPSAGSVSTVTVPVTLDKKRDDDLDLPSAVEMRVSGRLLHCRACHGVLADLSRLSCAMPLPTEHWMETAELWVCDPQTMSTIERPYGLPDRPVDERVDADRALVGLRDIIVPHNAIEQGGSIAAAGDSARIICAQCGCHVGTSVEGGIRFWKRSLVASDEMAGGPSAFSWYGNETDVTSLILQKCQARSCYLAEVVCRQQPDLGVISMQIINWDAFCIRASYSFNGQGFTLKNRFPVNAYRFAPIMKVLFRQHPRSTEPIPPFTSRDIVEEIELDSDLWFCLSSALQRSNQYYPPPDRQLNGLSVGFLARLSRII